MISGDPACRDQPFEGSSNFRGTCHVGFQVCICVERIEDRAGNVVVDFGSAADVSSI
jgi:hypothetical protein